LKSKEVARPVAVLETEIFCHRYLKINNFAIKQYFLMEFHNSFTDTFENK